MIVLVSVNTSCHISLSIGTCWGCFFWNRTFEYFRLLYIYICLGIKFREVLRWRIIPFSEEGLWACCKCKLSPSLVSGSVTGSRLLTISQLLLATCNLCSLQKSLCSEQVSHLSVVRRLCLLNILFTICLAAKHRTYLRANNAPDHHIPMLKRSLLILLGGWQ